jgi:hypothetical protein
MEFIASGSTPRIDFSFAAVLSRRYDGLHAAMPHVGLRNVP